MTNAEKREQVAKQLDVVAHLATVLAGVSKDYARIFREGPNNITELIDQVGDRTAFQMEALGDMLNNMDAVSDDDKWTAPVFQIAHRLWPQTQQQ